MIKVVIVDDQSVVCHGMKMLLDAQPNIKVVGVAYNGEEALEVIALNPPDVVLMDLKMPVMNGIQATKALREKYPTLPVVVLTTYDEDEWVVDAIRSGATGYLLKDCRTEEIIAALEGVVVGQTPVSSGVATKLFQYIQYGLPGRNPLDKDLNERELSILKLVANGLTNADIAKRLNLAEGTVRNYLTTIFSKLDVADRAQATALAWRYGIVSDTSK
jgi:DNA-binding NarL/FixJ family response regulator